jgi:hypothetical protein
MDQSQGSRYRSYMLRLWRAGSGPHAPWRASTECAVTGTRHTFPRVQDLVEFLLQETDSAGDGPAQDAESAPGSAHLPCDARE